MSCGIKQKKKFKKMCMICSRSVRLLFFFHFYFNSPIEQKMASLVFGQISKLKHWPVIGAWPSSRCLHSKFSNQWSNQKRTKPHYVNSVIVDDGVHQITKCGMPRDWSNGLSYQSTLKGKSPVLNQKMPCVVTKWITRQLRWPLHWIVNTCSCFLINTQPRDSLEKTVCIEEKIG